MEMKINTNISSEFKETSITINAPELTKEIQNLLQYVSHINEMPNQIMASENNKIYFIDLERVICFFSKDKYNYVRVKEGTYKIKQKLYELEDSLRGKDFIRISNSCLIHINQVECFDTSVLGTILVRLKDGTQETVSKRRVAQIIERKGEFEMKVVGKKLLKILLVLVVSTVVIYLVLTIPAFYSWCDENQMFVNSDELLLQLNPDKIQQLGDSVGQFAQLMEDDLQRVQNGTYEEGTHSLAEYYDPLGFSVWSHIQREMNELVHQYVTLSILSGIAVAIAYTIITIKKMNPIFKIAIGYFGVMLIVPPIYMYSWTYRFWDVLTMYGNMPKYFYIGYTLIFVVMYLINYKVGVKMTQKLNESMKKE